MNGVGVKSVGSAAQSATVPAVAVRMTTTSPIQSAVTRFCQPSRHHGAVACDLSVSGVANCVLANCGSRRSLTWDPRTRSVYGRFCDAVGDGAMLLADHRPHRVRRDHAAEVHV